ncbi:MAG: alpha/beta hydrolase [Methanomassiliicoccaceae archaeon]|nr:alpha/beta hydrolase [Methanomassiliicoccaceae archaeon]
MTERKETDSGGVRISYLKEYRDSGIPIILLHGNGEDSSLYSDLIGMLSDDGFSVYVMDSRGHGMSGKVDRLRYGDMADDVMHLIRHERLERPILFGFSDGGITGLLLAIKYPDALGRLIVAGINLSSDGIVLWARLLLRLIFLFTRSDKLRLMLTQPDIRAEQLRTIDVPTVVLYAEKDVVKLLHSETVAENVRNGELIRLEGHTHDSYVRDNTKLYELLADHIREE